MSTINPTEFAPEKKYYHSYSNGFVTVTSITGNGCHHLNDVTQGTGRLQRIGLRVNNVYLRVRFNLSNYGSTVQRPCMVRAAIVLDRNINGATATTPDEIWKDNTGWEDRAVAYRNTDNMARFRILKEKDFQLYSSQNDANADTSADRAACYQEDWYVPIPKDESITTYKSGTAVPQTNGLYFVVYWSSFGGTYPNLAYSSALCYTD